MKTIKILLLVMCSLFAVDSFSQSVPRTPQSPMWSPSQQQQLNSIQPYKKIVTRVTQSSTSAPVDTTVEDNQSITHSWIRLGAGNYRIVTDTGFSVTKTFIFTGNTVATCSKIRAWVISVDSIGVQTTDTVSTLADGLLLNTPFEIRMYP